MLLMNQRIDKLTAFRVEATAHKMLKEPLGTTVTSVAASDPAASLQDSSELNTPAWGDAEQDSCVADGPKVSATVTLAHNRGKIVKKLTTPYADLAPSPEQSYPAQLRPLSEFISRPSFPNLIQQFLFDQIHPDVPEPGFIVDVTACPAVDDKLCVAVYHSATSVYWAPSDHCGVGGMSHDIIWAMPSWRRGPARHDCIFLEKDGNTDGL